MVSNAFTLAQFLSIGLCGVIFLLLRKFCIGVLKTIYLQSVARLGNRSIRWILEHDELEEIGMQCSWKQPVLSLIFLVSCALTPLFIHHPVQIFARFIFMFQLFIIAWMDASTGYILNFLNYVLISSGIIYNAIFQENSLFKYYLISFLLGYFFLWMANCIGKKVYKRDQIGEADFLFFAGINAWLGCFDGFEAFFWGNAIALLVCFLSNQKRLRYAPYLAYGTLIVVHTSKNFLMSLLLF